METLEAVNEKTRKAYNLAADRYHELFHDEMSGKEWDLALLDAFAGRFDERSCVLDAGCGPCVSAGRVLVGKGVSVIGVDISDRCVELARAHNPAMRIERGDLAALPFPDASFQGVLSYYSIIDTPKRLASTLVDEFRRVLVPGGHLLVVVKAGEREGWESSLLGVEAAIYFSTFTEDELRRLLETGGFHIESIETREPYPFEIEARRIYALAHRDGGMLRGHRAPRGQSRTINFSKGSERGVQCRIAIASFARIDSLVRTPAKRIVCVLFPRPKVNSPAVTLCR